MLRQMPQFPVARCRRHGKIHNLGASAPPFAMNLTYWLNTAWMAKCRSEARALEHSTHSVEEAQAQVLRAIVRGNRDTEYGRKYGFARIDCPADFRRQVPLSSYENYAESIDRIAAGAPGVLTRQPVQLFEPTSGTTRGEKWIPYTASLRRQYQRMAAAWIHDLMRSRPAIRRGRAYWSISPALSVGRRTSGGIPIGFDDDTQYLGGVERFLARRLLAVPPSVTKLAPLENFRYATLLYLLRTRDLALVSVWSPTFLEALLTNLHSWSDRLGFDLEHGGVSWPQAWEDQGGSEQPARNSEPWGADVTAAAVVRSSDSMPEKLQQLWPRLALISCWADASAALYVPRLRELFPHVEIQPKGLLATEGCVSFPIMGHAGSVLALRSHFFEFQEHGVAEDDSRACRLTCELERGGRYRVVLTTGGGLYRYRLGDVVEVVGFVNQCPTIRFLGRSGAGCDLVGEKLSEAFVQSVLDRVLREQDLSSRFALLAPVEGRPPHYQLYLQPAGPTPPQSVMQAVIDALQAGLEENPHYRYAVELGQLGAADLVVLDPAGASAWSFYERQRIARGQKPGDIKPAALDAWTGWQAEFKTLVNVTRPPLTANRFQTLPGERPASAG